MFNYFFSDGFKCCCSLDLTRGCRVCGLQWKGSKSVPLEEWHRRVRLLSVLPLGSVVGITTTKVVLAIEVIRQNEGASQRKECLDSTPEQGSGGTEVARSYNYRCVTGHRESNDPRSLLSMSRPEGLSVGRSVGRYAAPGPRCDCT